MKYQEGMELLFEQVESLPKNFDHPTKVKIGKIEEKTDTVSLAPTQMYNGEAGRFYDAGYAVIIGDEVKALASIYEPGPALISKHGFIAFSGHEKMVTLWLNTMEFESVYTR